MTKNSQFHYGQEGYCTPSARVVTCMVQNIVCGSNSMDRLFEGGEQTDYQPLY